MWLSYLILFVTEPAPSTDEKPASEPMETDKPEPEPEPKVDASVEKVCVVNVVSLPFIQNFGIFVRNEIKFYCPTSSWKTLHG